MIESNEHIAVNNKAPYFSFLLPTRRNVEMLGNFLDSIVRMTHCLDLVEVVLCVDSDDEKTLNYEHSGVTVLKTVVEPGTAMGIMNNRCYEVSCGTYVMLMNDDVLMQTKGWDSFIWDALNLENDGHVLVHVNDLLFGKKLCTFPMLSRQTIELVGFCPEEFHRFAIDDYLFDIFHILRYLGHDRIRYMENVVFEHLNYQLDADDINTRIYKPKISPELDWTHYQNLLSRRKQAALQLATDIDGDARNEAAYLKYLENVTINHEYRQMEPMKSGTGIHTPKHVIHAHAGIHEG